MMRIIFYDGPCPLCNWVVRWLMQADRKKLFWFSSLQGKTALEKKIPQDQDSLLLLEEMKGSQKSYIAAKCVMKIFWLLGGKYRLIGWMYFMPAFLMDPCYRLVAKNRYRLFTSKKQFLLDQTRLLP